MQVGDCVLSRPNFGSQRPAREQSNSRLPLISALGQDNQPPVNDRNVSLDEPFPQGRHSLSSVESQNAVRIQPTRLAQ
jgi:hypothetical protein